MSPLTFILIIIAALAFGCYYDSVQKEEPEKDRKCREQEMIREQQAKYQEYLASLKKRKKSR